MTQTSEPQLLLAIDGGQTATTVALATTEGDLVAIAHGGPIVDVYTQTNADVMRAAFGEAIPAVMAKVPLERREIALSYLSLTGGAVHAAGAVRSFVPSREIVIESDVFAVLAAATQAGSGIGLIAGTGSIAGAVSDSGKRIVQGGWGFLLGDEGSGFWIGRAAVQAAIAADERRGSATVLHELVLDHFGVADLRSASAQIYDRLDRVAIAALAKVTIAAAESDAAAADIALYAGRQLAQLVASTVAAARPTTATEKRVAPGGGILQPGNAVWRAMAGRLTDLLPDFELLLPVHPPVIGSLMLALRQFHGVAADGPLKRLERSLLNTALPRGKARQTR